MVVVSVDPLGAGSGVVDPAGQVRETMSTTTPPGVYWEKWEIRLQLPYAYKTIGTHILPYITEIIQLKKV